MVKFLKIRDVKSPQREKGNAGIDVFVPNYSDEYCEALNAKNPGLKMDCLHCTNAVTGESVDDFYVIVLDPGDSVNIPTGLKTSFPENIALEAANKSGVATKKKLFVGASVVDSSYQGEIHAHVVNVGNEQQVIGFGEKIVQFIPRLIDTEEHEVVEGISSDEFYGGIKTIRGEGGFGSTGTI